MNTDGKTRDIEIVDRLFPDNEPILISQNQNKFFAATDLARTKIAELEEALITAEFKIEQKNCCENAHLKIAKMSKELDKWTRFVRRFGNA